jgi:hypothetical protein
MISGTLDFIEEKSLHQGADIQLSVLRIVSSMS